MLPVRASTTATVNYDITAPTAPTGLTLAAGQDTGSSATDGITNINTPQFTGTPTGTVTFMDKGAALAAGDGGQSSTVTLVNGAATFTTTVGQLAAGQQHTITAVYSGDTNFVSSTSPTLTISLGLTPRRKVISLTWSRPSIPPRSTNAP